MDLLVSTDWLAGELGATDLVVLDCTVVMTRGDEGIRTDSGRPMFESSHIPGAGFADLKRDIADLSSPNEFALPTPEALAAAMEQLGVADGRRVVLYDNDHSLWASRVWLMLRWIGLDAAILDGGLQAWIADERPLEDGPATSNPATPGSLTVSLRPRLIADKEEVMAALDDGVTCLVDSLPAEMYRGEMQAYARAGHIPGAINVPARSMIDPGTGRFRPIDEFRAVFPDRPEARVVSY